MFLLRSFEWQFAEYSAEVTLNPLVRWGFGENSSILS